MNILIFDIVIFILAYLPIKKFISIVHSHYAISGTYTEYFRFGNTPATAKIAMAYKNKYDQPVRNLPAPQKTP